MYFGGESTECSKNGEKRNAAKNDKAQSVAAKKEANEKKMHWDSINKSNRKAILAKGKYYEAKNEQRTS